MARATTGATKGAKASKKGAKKQAKKAAARTATRTAAVPKKSAAKHAASKRPAKTAKKPRGAGSAARDEALAKFLDEQRSALDSERASYVTKAETLKAEADQMAQEAEPGDVQFDEESGEGGTMNIDRERDLALSAQARAAVEDIDLALAKIANGTYGTCESCGQPIPKARLKALPQARLCVACKSGGLSRR